jgi:hypothetical protein
MTEIATMTASEFYDASLTFSCKQDRLTTVTRELDAILKERAKLLREIDDLAKTMEPALVALGEGEIVVLHGWCFWKDDSLDVRYTRERKYLEIIDQEQEQEASFTPTQIDEAAMHAAFQAFSDLDLDKIEAQIMLGDRDDAMSSRWNSTFFDPKSID